MAERILAAQGWNAWPSCSRKTGVRGHVAAPASRWRRRPPPARRRPRRPRRPPPKSVAKNGADYTIAKRGDTLSTIAARDNVAGGGRRVYDRNADVLSSPHVLRVGQQLDLG